MSKYLCLCGAQYDNRAGVNLHMDAVDHDTTHIILKRKWRGRLFNFLVEGLDGKILKIIGIVGAHGIFIHHFHYNWWESMVSAVCVGFLM